MQEQMCNVCSQNASDKTSKTTKNAIYADITYEHFDKALAELKTGGAQGPPRVTANMIKAWPRSTKIFAYKYMSNIWKSRTILIWFEDKLMKLAPNIPGNNQMDNMRPINLYENNIKKYGQQQWPVELKEFSMREDYFMTPNTDTD
jgi:hypothetical protein